MSAWDWDRNIEAEDHDIDFLRLNFPQYLVLREQVKQEIRTMQRVQDVERTNWKRKIFEKEKINAYLGAELKYLKDEFERQKANFINTITDKEHEIIRENDNLKQKKAELLEVNAALEQSIEDSKRELVERRDHFLDENKLKEKELNKKMGDLRAMGEENTELKVELTRQSTILEEERKRKEKELIDLADKHEQQKHNLSEKLMEKQACVDTLNKSISENEDKLRKEVEESEQHFELLANDNIKVKEIELRKQMEIESSRYMVKIKDKDEGIKTARELFESKLICLRNVFNEEKRLLESKLENKKNDLTSTKETLEKEMQAVREKDKENIYFKSRQMEREAELKAECIKKIAELETVNAALTSEKDELLKKTDEEITYLKEKYSEKQKDDRDLLTQMKTNKDEISKEYKRAEQELLVLKSELNSEKEKTWRRSKQLEIEQQEKMQELRKMEYEKMENEIESINQQIVEGTKQMEEEL